MGPKSERFELRIDEGQLLRVDDWAREQDDRPTRAEAVRRLVDLGLSVGSRRAVHFSDGEKMLILMMGDVFKALEVKGPEVDPRFLAEVIYGGHYWAPTWTMSGAFHGHIDTQRDVRHVANVLDMWWFIELAYDRCSPEEKQEIADQVGPRGANVKFSGFDGNNETNHLSIARFFTKHMGRFTHFSGRDLDSHFPTDDRYSRMLRIFEPMRPSLGDSQMSVRQIVALLKA
jgi:uncharacterized protein YfbU (UPF0304 family)